MFNPYGQCCSRLGMFRAFIIYPVCSLSNRVRTTNDTLSAHRPIGYRLTNPVFCFLANCSIKSVGTPLAHRGKSWTCTRAKHISQAARVFCIDTIPMAAHNGGSPCLNDLSRALASYHPPVPGGQAPRLHSSRRSGTSQAKVPSTPWPTPPSCDGHSPQH